MGFYSSYDEQIKTISDDINKLSSLIDIVHNKVVKLKDGTELIEDLNNVQDQVNELKMSIRKGTLQ